MNNKRVIPRIILVIVFVLMVSSCGSEGGEHLKNSEPSKQTQAETPKNPEPNSATLSYSPNFSEGLSDQFNHGNPSSEIIDAANRMNVLDPNGDGCYDSGVVFNSGPSFNYSKGVSIEFDYYMNTSEPIWNSITVGFVGTVIGGSPVGDDGCFNASDSMPDPRDGVLIITPTGTNQITFYGQSQSFEFSDGVVQSEWHRIKIIIRDNSSYELYYDGRFIRIHQRYDPSTSPLYDQEVYLWLAGRSFSDENILIDNVTVKYF